MAFAIRNRRGARVGARRGQRFATRPTPARSFQQYANSGAQVFFFASFFALPAISFLMRFTEAPETNMSIELSPPWSLRARFHEWTDDSSDKPSRLSSPSSVMWIILTMLTSRHSVRRGIISYASAQTYLRNVRFWHLAEIDFGAERVRFWGQGIVPYAPEPYLCWYWADPFDPRLLLLLNATPSHLDAVGNACPLLAHNRQRLETT